MAHAWDAAQVARAAGGRLLHPARATRPGGPGRRVSSSTRARPAPATSSSACAASTPTAGASPLRRSRRAPGACWWTTSTPRRSAAARSRAARSSPRPTRSPRSQRSRAPGAASWAAHVVGITGSTGKTSTKDVLAGDARAAPPRRGDARENLNTEIGLPLTVLAAPEGTEALVLEMAMRGAGQIAELARDRRARRRASITNVGPVHLELLGTSRRSPPRRRSCMPGCAPGGTAVVPAGEPLLEPAPPRGRRDGDVRPRRRRRRAPGGPRAPVRRRAHMRRNALAALAAARGGRGRAARPGGRSRCQRAARPARCVLADGVGRRGRLLQRQPDVDARRPRRPRRVGAGPPGRRARRHARARRRRAALPRARWAPTPPSPASTCCSPSAPGRMRRPRPSAPRRPPARRSTTCPTPRRPPPPRPSRETRPSRSGWHHPRPLRHRSGYCRRGPFVCRPRPAARHRSLHAAARGR